ncbi:MAG: bifunctional 3-(3-hydroxy-phenyl)propionate/3-hydroxycinnamic acid hydroxylase [Arenibacterium sp.]
MRALPEHIPVVIIGAGPTGLCAANLLARYDVSFLLLERDPEPFDLPRAIVLDDEGLRTCQVFGLPDLYLPQTLEATGARYYADDGSCFAEVGAGPRSYGFAKRQYIHQPEFEAALRARLDATAPGTLHFGSEVTSVQSKPDGCKLMVTRTDGTSLQIKADWVLACDGGRSPTRDDLNIEMSGDTYEQDWIVLDTADDPDGAPFSRFYCSNKRPHVSIPAPHGGRRYEFMLLPGETREEVLQDKTLAELVGAERDFDPARVIRKTVYTFHARIAERFRDERVLLLGDAAHLTPPFAGQGMNAGLRDAHNVTWKIRMALESGAARALDSYETERRKPAWDMIQLAVTMGDVVMPTGAAEVAFRNHLIRALEPFPAVRDYLVQMRFKPRPRHPKGLYLDLNTPEFEASLVGEMIPQPHVSRAGQRKLLDDVLGSGFALIAQDAPGYAALDALTQVRLLGLPLECVRLGHGHWHPEQSDIARPLRTHRDQIMLIRPDRYCAAAFAPADLPQTLARFRALLEGDTA